MQKALNTFVAFINIVLSLLTIIVSPAIMLASWLMTPDWTSGDIFGIRPVMHKLWITISNITYFIYAILLIFIALATIFNSQNYGYKQLLPRLALGIILVPMTFWFVQFTISLATVVTASVVSIPMETLEKKITDDSWWNTYLIPKSITYSNDNDKEAFTSSGTELKNGGLDKVCGINKANPKGNNTNCLSPKQVTSNAG
jgi:hypothetical protein